MFKRIKNKLVRITMDITLLKFKIAKWLIGDFTIHTSKKLTFNKLDSKIIFITIQYTDKLNVDHVVKVTNSTNCMFVVNGFNVAGIKK